MTSETFIFSNNAWPKLSRHLAFWVGFAIYLFLYRFYVRDFQEVFQWNTYAARLRSTVLFFPVAVCYAYFSMYYLLPRYIMKGRYRQLLLLVILFALILLVCSHLISPVVDIRTVWDVPSRRDAFLEEVDFVFHNVLVFPLTVSGFAIGIRIAKDWYLKQKETGELEQLKMKMELRLQKMQLHPRFLFHSLNIIHAELLKSSAASPAMLLKLSHILSYLLYETEADKLSLYKELDILQNYITLAKPAHGDSLQIRVDIERPENEYLIAPLILMPLLEHAFGISQPGESIQLGVSGGVTGSRFGFSVSMQASGECLDKLIHNKEQLEVVRRRLENQYPGDFSLDIARNQREITIELLLPLERKRNSSAVTTNPIE